jgi:hypothetical protein
VDTQSKRKPKILRRSPARTLWISVFAGLTIVVLILTIGAGLLRAQFRDSNADQQNDAHQQRAEEESIDPANAGRKKQIADESAQLLKLATDLKSEVDKSNKDTLSMTVIRKADAIEKLAREVKDKMKLTAGGS